ncbi:MAG: HAD family hydrolase [Spirochaetaceae bacterium]|nr:HAD family hydrolase [Spirochaetaceae bacterium]
MRYSAVAFDLDGTLYPPFALYRQAWPIILASARRFIAFSAVRHELRERAKSDDYRRAMTASGDASARTAFLKYQAKMTAERLGEGPAAIEAFLEARYYRGVDEVFARLEPYRGMAQTLTALREGGLRLALLSDFPPRRKLELLGLSGYFEAALCSEDTGFLKPAAEPFAALAAALGLPADRILYVGNSRAYDIAGAKAAGMGAALRGRATSPDADLRFADWRVLKDFALS